MFADIPCEYEFEHIQTCYSSDSLVLFSICLFHTWDHLNYCQNNQKNKSFGIKYFETNAIAHDLHNFDSYN